MIKISELKYGTFSLLIHCDADLVYWSYIGVHLCIILAFNGPLWK